MVRFFIIFQHFPLKSNRRQTIGLLYWSSCPKQTDWSERQVHFDVGKDSTRQLGNFITNSRINGWISQISDFKIEVKDPTGKITGTMKRSILAKHKLTPGCVFCLVNVCIHYSQILLELGCYLNKWSWNVNVSCDIFHEFNFELKLFRFLNWKLYWWFCW